MDLSFTSTLCAYMPCVCVCVCVSLVCSSRIMLRTPKAPVYFQATETDEVYRRTNKKAMMTAWVHTRMVVQNKKTLACLRSSSSSNRRQARYWTGYATDLPLTVCVCTYVSSRFACLLGQHRNREYIRKTQASIPWWFGFGVCWPIVSAPFTISAIYTNFNDHQQYVSEINTASYFTKLRPPPLKYPTIIIFYTNNCGKREKKEKYKIA